MRGKLAKLLRRAARARTAGMLERSKMSRYWRGGPFAHGDQTTRAVYQRLKREYLALPRRTGMAR